MKAWKKGAVIGGIWGLVSFLIWLGLIASEFAHSPPKKETEYAFIILFFPGFLGMYLADKLSGIIFSIDELTQGKNLATYWKIKIFSFIIIPVISGSFIGGMVNHLYEKWRGSK